MGVEKLPRTNNKLPLRQTGAPLAFEKFNVVFEINR